MGVFDINGNNIGGNPFLQNASIERGYYLNSQYYLIRINKRKYDGTYQYPFVIAPNGWAPATQSALDFALQHNYPIVINAGVFDVAVGTTKPNGILIVNGVVLHNAPYNTWKPMTIDANGNLNYEPVDVDADTLNVPSAVCGFWPLVVNYVGVNPTEYPSTADRDNGTQRMIIGQFGNGDYAILCVEGRNNDHSTGLTIANAITLCESLNLKFAYNLDGGGSTELVIGKKQLNTIYEGTTGRKVPTFIVFNGTDTYGEPE